MQNKHGFTLVELLVVMVIIAVLAGLLMPAIRKSRSKALVDKAQAEMAAFASVVTMVKMDTGYYVRLTDLSTVDTSASGDEPYIFSESTGQVFGPLDGSTPMDTHISHWEGPYQVFQPGAVLNGYGIAPSPGTTAWVAGDFPAGTPLDPWGRAYGLAYNPAEKVMVIYSAGPNGRMETDYGDTVIPADSDDLLFKFR